MQAQPTSNLFTIGLQLDSAKEYNKAIEAYNKVIETDENHVAARYNRSILYLNQKKYSNALIDLNFLLKTPNTNANIYFNRFFVHKQLGNWEFALNDLEIFNKLIPNNMEGLKLLLSLTKQMGYLDKSKNAWYSLSKISAPNVTDYLTLAEIYANNKEVDSAILVLNSLKENANNTDKIYLITALVENYNNLFDQSLKNTQLYILNNKNDVFALKLMADNLFYLGKYAQSLAIYKSVEALDSIDLSLKYDIGICHVQLQNYTLAITYLNQCLQNNTGDMAYAYLSRGICYYKLKNFNLACTDWHKSSMLGNKGAKKYLNSHCIKTQTP